MKCNRKNCVKDNFDATALQPCEACIKHERERLTETKENRDRAWRIEQMKKHIRKDEQE